MLLVFSFEVSIILIFYSIDYLQKLILLRFCRILLHWFLENGKQRFTWYLLQKILMFFIFNIPFLRLRVFDFFLLWIKIWRHSIRMMLSILRRRTSSGSSLYRVRSMIHWSISPEHGTILICLFKLRVRHPHLIVMISQFLHNFIIIW